MTLYTDIPTRAEIDALWNAAFPTSVSLYVPTEPASSGQAEQIAFKNLARAALDQLAGADKNDLGAVEEALADLGEDDGFWRRQARTLAVFATPAWLRTFRLPNRLMELAVGGERLYVKPLMRAVTVPQTAFVLALAQGGVRLLETVPDAPAALVRVPDMPSDVATAAGKASIKDRAPIRRLQGDEGQKVRIRQYARRVDDALREVLPGHGVPLVIAATEPLDSIFRSVCRYPEVVPESVRGNPESVPDVELVQQARAVLDRYYAGKARRAARVVRAAGWAEPHIERCRDRRPPGHPRRGRHAVRRHRRRRAWPGRRGRGRAVRRRASPGQHRCRR
jgi:hypothetical protein